MEHVQIANVQYEVAAAELLSHLEFTYRIKYLYRT
jgi:hypothetical protein